MNELLRKTTYIFLLSVKNETTKERKMNENNPNSQLQSRVHTTIVQQYTVVSVGSSCCCCCSSAAAVAPVASATSNRRHLQCFQGEKGL